MRISSIMFTVGLLALATPAVAQSLDPTARSIGVDAKTRAKFKRLQQLRLKRPKSRRPVKDYTALTDEKTMSAVGTLREAIDGMVLLSVPIDAATADKMVRLRVRRVREAKDIGHNTIFDSQLYLQYMTAPKGPSSEALKSHVGKRVHLTLSRNQGGFAVVTGVRAQ